MSILDFACLGKENPQLVEAFAPLIPAELKPKILSGELFAIGSLLADLPNGAVVFSLKDERAELYSIYVDEYDRRHRTGSELLEELEATLKAMGGIYCMELCLPGDCDEGVCQFLSACGFEIISDEASEAIMTLGAIKALELPKPKLATLSGTELSGAVLRNIEAELKARDSYFLEGSLSAPPVMPELCRYTAENGAITAGAVITGEEPLSLAFLFGDNPAAITSVLYDARAALLEKYPEDGELYINVASEGGTRLAKKLLDENKFLGRRLARKSI